MNIWQAITISLLFLPTIVTARITDVSCVYETTGQVIIKGEHRDQNEYAQKTNKWFFWRTEKTIEVANGERTFGEKWTITGNKQVFYQALYHDKNFLLDFQPTDLKILNKKTSWEIRSTIFPKRLLKQLKQTTKNKFNQYDRVHYKGKIAGVDYKIDWLPKFDLPARIEKSSPDKVVIELKEIYPLAKSLYQQQSTEKYEDMEYADIGDNESHPVVAQLQNSRGIGYTHQH